MTRTSEYHGQWWVAGRPDRKVQAVLRVVEGERPELHTVGSLLGQVFGASEARVVPLRVLGALESYSGATLEGCHLKSSTILVEQPREVWVVDEVVFGLHVSPEDAWSFFGATFEMPLVTDWVSPQSLETRFLHGTEGRPNSISITASAEAKPLWAASHFEVDLTRDVEVNREGEGVKRLVARANVRVFGSSRTSIEDLESIAVRPLQLLVGLSTGLFTTPIRGGVFGGPRQKDLPLRTYERCWFSRHDANDASDTRYGFGYADFMALPEEARARWLESLPSLKPVTDLYLGALQRHTFAEQRFLFLVQGLETFHRLKHSRELIPGDVWDDLRNRLFDTMESIPAALPRRADAIQALGAKLRFLNEQGLRARLKELLAMLGPIGHVVASGDVSEFVRRVTDTRNYYTHWSVELERLALRRADLVYASQRLYALLEVLLLREIGFVPDSGAVRQVMNRRLAWLPSRS